MQNTFTTSVALEVALNDATERVLEKIVSECLNKLIENIRDGYQPYNQDYFVNNRQARTGQFESSFILGDIQKDLTSVFREIIHTPEIMSATQARFRDSWNAHMSNKGVDMREHMAEILNVGGSDRATSATSTGVYERPKENPFWDNTLKWIEENYRQLFKKYYAEEGIHIQ